MILRFPFQRFGKLLVAIVLILSFFHLVSLALHAFNDNPVTELLVEKFSFDLERNFPTYYSSSVLLLSSLLFFLIAWAEKSSLATKDYKYWLGLGFVFLFLSMDEAAHIHEHFSADFLWGAYSSTGLLAWPWVIVYGCLVSLFVVGYFKFWINLPASFKWSYFVAGVVYVCSALGFEMLEAQEYSTNQSTYTYAYHVFTFLEEFFEMSAISFLVYTNMRYLAQIFSKTSFSFGTITKDVSEPVNDLTTGF